MIPPRVLIPLVGAASAFGATGLVLALMGVGAPFLLAALILSDRLVASTDPAIRKAGEAVVRSIEQASALIAAFKTLEPPGDGTARPPSDPAGSAARPGGP